MLIPCLRICLGTWVVSRDIVGSSSKSGVIRVRRHRTRGVEADSGAHQLSQRVGIGLMADRLFGLTGLWSSPKQKRDFVGSQRFICLIGVTRLRLLFFASPVSAKGTVSKGRLPKGQSRLFYEIGNGRKKECAKEWGQGGRRTCGPWYLPRTMFERHWRAGAQRS